MKQFGRPISKDVDDLFEVFEQFSVSYLLVGAYAVMVYTEPRFTKDIDLWIEPTVENGNRAYAALKKFGAPLTGLTSQDFSEPGFFYTMGIAPGRIDILMSLGGVVFSEAFGRKNMISIGGRKIPTIGKEDLIIAKLAASRPQDLIDIENLKKSI